MYYNSNQQTNDYYNSYKREMQELDLYNQQEKRQRVLKNIFFVIISLLIFLSSFYLYKYFNSDVRTQRQKVKVTLSKQLPPPIVIREENRAKSSQIDANSLSKVSNQNTNISPKDIALIVQIIITQLNNQKKKSLEEQLALVASKQIVSMNSDRINHYNKVILNDSKIKKKNKIQNQELLELSNKMNKLLAEKVVDRVATNYSNAIKKEIAFRTNEMRVVVVEKGDTLSKIAKKAYGDYNDYPKIFSANPEIIKNPDQIFVGMRLRIPS